MKQSFRHQGFTLVELLVTIAIIAILAGILLPVVLKAFGKANEAKVRTELKSIETAVKAYMNEYSKLPIADAKQGGTDFALTEAESKALIKIIAGENPRKISFLESNNTDGTFQDPWDKQYLMWVDSNYDNQIITSGTNKYYTQVVVYSIGDGTNAYYSAK